MSTRKLSRAWARAVADAQQTAAHCGVTIGARLPILSGLTASTGEAMTEWDRAYSEKVAAAWGGAIAASAAWQSVVIASLARPATPASFANDVLHVMDKAARPARRRVKANAKRLTRPKQKGL